MKTLNKILVIASCIVLGLGILYLGVAFYYTNRFLPRTTINNIDCSGKTIREAEEALQTSVDDYCLRIIEKNGIIEERTSEDFGLIYEGTEGLEALLEKENPFLWVLAVFQSSNEHVEVLVTYKKNAFVETVSGLECMKEENQVKCSSAKLVYQNGVYVIKDEVEGKEINRDVIYDVILKGIESMTTSINLEESQCYLVPAYTSDSPEVLAAQETLNLYLSTCVTYQVDSEELVVDYDIVHQWLEVDEDMNVNISEEKVREFAEFLSSSYDTEDGPQIMTTPLGKEVSIENAQKGRKVDVEAEFVQLMEDVKAGTSVTRSLIWAQEGTSMDQPGWGTSYIEVDMGEQHMWYIKEGEIVFECDIVTGKPSSPTPTGMYRIIEKMEDKVLRGEIQPDGSYGYESPVNYWMRLTWSGIGFHDATWQSKFGGERYLNGYGSHGCINMPLDKAEEFYNMISVGDRVVLHN